jgi:Fe-S-cluster containining protein
MSGCSGACCAAFYIPHTIRAIRRGVSADGETRLEQAEQLADMLIPLTPKQARERSERFGGTNGERFVWADRGHHFTCKHWDEESRLCTIYPDRPDMCRGYPYGDRCTYDENCECTGSPIDDLLANAEIVRDAVMA